MDEAIEEGKEVGGTGAANGRNDVDEVLVVDVVES